MEGERSHRSSGSSSELFICFTSRPSNSSSMKISSKSILSPGRTDKIREGTLSTLPSSLSRRLRSNGSMKGGQSSPMFPSCTKKKGGCAFETAEPSSPKVTCIGQVRVKTKKQGKKKKKAMRTMSKRWGEDGSFRKTEQGQEGHLQQEYLPSRSHKWVHLPLSICEALRAFGAEFNCFVPCGGWRSSCSSNSGAERDKGEKQRRRRSSCGAVFARWLMVLQESEEEKKSQVLEERVELVGEEEEDQDKAKVEEEKGEEKIDVEIDEAEEVSICIPPRNALLLMRCRSEPLRMSALATRFWDSPAPKEQENEVEEDDDTGDEEDGEEEQQIETEAEQSEEKAVAFYKEHPSPEKEEKEEAEEQEEEGLEKGSLPVPLDKQENSKEEYEEEKETHLWRTAVEGEKEEKEEEDTQLQKAGKDPEEEGEELQFHETAEAEAGEGEEYLHLHERTAAAAVVEEGVDTQLQETAAIAAEDEMEEAQLRRAEPEAQLQETAAVAAKQEREETLLQKTDAEVRTPETDEEEKEAGGREEEVEAHPQKAGGEESHLPNGEEEEEKEEGGEGERKEKTVEERRMSFCSTASLQHEEGEEAEKLTIEEKENAEGMAAVEVAAAESEEMPTAGEEWRMVEGRGEERERSSQLPDCLLLMMCEPKLSMEVSKETWVCSTDFLRHRPHKAPAAPAPQAGKRKEAVVEDCRRLSTDSNPAKLPPVTAVAPNPAPQQPLCVATVIEQKLANPKVYQPFVLTRCKSEPMRSSAKLAPEACFWKSRRLPPPPRPIGISATGVRR